MKRFFDKYKYMIVLLVYTLIYFVWFYSLERDVTTVYASVDTKLDEFIPFHEVFVIPYVIWFGYCRRKFGLFEVFDHIISEISELRFRFRFASTASRRKHQTVVVASAGAGLAEIREFKNTRVLHVTKLIPHSAAVGFIEAARIVREPGHTAARRFAKANKVNRAHVR